MIEAFVCKNETKSSLPERCGRFCSENGLHKNSSMKKLIKAQMRERHDESFFFN